MPSMIDDRQTERIAGIALTHPERVLYEGIDLSKRDLARYYAAVGDRMLPYVRDRLLSLVRCPDGQRRACFFQKHPGRGKLEGLHLAELVESSGKVAHYVFVRDLQGLIALVQMSTLEIHLWGSSVDAIERPDRLVIDVDPDASVAFGEVKRAALALRDRLAELGLRSFALVTGGKGVHVVAPLERRREWGEVKAFARALAVEFAHAEPQRFVAVASKAQRRGRIFIDYLRNDRGSTAIAPYSTRAKPGAPVATPVSWEELQELARPNGFGVREVMRRVAQEVDPWADYFGLRQSITKKALAGVGAVDDKR